jgi:hypothetical protein
VTAVTVAAAREHARKRYERHHVSWALAAAAGEPPDPTPLVLPLHPPTESTVLAEPAGAVEWVSSWRRAGIPGVGWEPRRWASVGAQEVPVRLTMEDPGEVARLAGRAPHWNRALARIRALLDQWAPGRCEEGAAGSSGESDAVRRAVRTHARAILALDDADFARLDGVLGWLVDHPASGAYIRQLPIRGVDTKWVGRHRGLVTGLHRAITGAESLGLAAMPDLVRIRLLDPDLVLGGLSDITAPPEELDALPIRPAVVVVVENLETLVAMPPLAGTVAVHGGGFAVDRLARISWIRDGDVRYWGDLDSHGFAILDRFRAVCPRVRSVLMDRATLEAHRDLWVPEPRSSRAEMPRLDAEERATLAMLRAQGGVRLEQERCDWGASVRHLKETIKPGVSRP